MDRKGAKRSVQKTVRIAILLGAPFSEQNYERIGIPYLTKHFEVIVFDCTKWLGRDTQDIDYKQAAWKELLTINTEYDFYVQIESCKPHYAIDFVGLGEITPAICDALEKNNVRFIVQKMGGLPAPTVIQKLRHIWRKRFTLKAVAVSHSEDGGSKSSASLNGGEGLVVKASSMMRSKLKTFFLIRRLRAFSSPVGLIAGNKSIDRFTRMCAPIIWVGSNDYHTFYKVKRELQQGRGALAIKHPYILFIDDYLANASDWKLLNIKPPVTETAYYSALNTYFESMESYYGLPIVIAGHPNSVTHDRYSIKVGGREVIYGNTAALAMQATLILLHGSTAASFAVLAKKPTIFLTSQELDVSHYGLHIRAMAGSLGSPLVFIDKPDQIAELGAVQVDDRRYKCYELSYLCNSFSGEGEPWEGLVRFIQQQTNTVIE